jgi:hypothetical protein
MNRTMRRGMEEADVGRTSRAEQEAGERLMKAK